MKKMSFEDYIKFFSKFDFASLETINYLIPFESKEEERAFIKAYNDKLDEERENLEGMNEYDDITGKLNCDIEKVKCYIENNKFKKSELEYFKKLVSSIQNQEEKMYDNIDADEVDLTYNELLSMFNKYSLPELDLIFVMLAYVYDYDMTEVRKALTDTYSNKEEKYFETERTVPTEIDKFNIYRVNEILSEQELKFLLKLIEDSYLYLSAVRDFSDEYENAIEDFDLREYPIDLTNKFLDSLNEELEERKYNIKKK